MFPLMPAAVSGAQQVNTINIPSISWDSIFTSISIFFLTFQNSPYYFYWLDFVVFWKFFATFASLVFLLGIVFVAIKIRRFHADEARKLHEEEIKLGIGSVESQQASVQNTKWQRVLEHSQSENPNDWRLAILEADVLLDEMLDSMALNAPTIGEKLQMLDRATFPNIQKAWDAHLVRNKIAHEGADFQLSQRETRRVISLYEEVLKSGLYM
jgi:hypothetical protein